MGVSNQVSSQPKEASTTGVAVGVAIAASAALITVPLVVIAISYWIVVRDDKLRRRKEREQAIHDKEQNIRVGTEPRDERPYLQSKGELGTEECEKRELPGEGSRKELQGSVQRCELSHGDNSALELSTTKDQRRASRLRGGELDARALPSELDSQIQ